MGLFSPKKKLKERLYIEVTRGSVIGAVLLETKTKSGIVLRNAAQVEERVDENAHDEKHRYFRYEQAVRDCLQRLAVNRKVLDEIVVVFDAPWGGSFWKDMKLSRRHPVAYSRGVQEHLRKEAEEQYRASHQSKDHQQTLLGLTPIHVKLNGYHVQDPIGKKAEEVSVTFQYDMVAESMRSALEKILEAALPHRDIVWMTRDALTYRGLQLFAPDKSRTVLFLLVDDVRTNTILRTSKGALEQQLVQVGMETFIERLTNSFGKDHHQAKHLLSLYLAGMLEDSLQSKIKIEAGAVCTLWEKQVRQAVSQLVQRGDLPSRFVYTISDVFQKIISREQVEQVIQDAMPGREQPVFIDFRDSVLVTDAPGVVSRQGIYMYAATLA